MRSNSAISYLHLLPTKFSFVHSTLPFSELMFRAGHWETSAWQVSSVGVITPLATLGSPKIRTGRSISKLEVVWRGYHFPKNSSTCSFIVLYILLYCSHFKSEKKEIKSKQKIYIYIYLYIPKNLYRKIFKLFQIGFRFWSLSQLTAIISSPMGQFMLNSYFFVKCQTML